MEYIISKLSKVQKERLVKDFTFSDENRDIIEQLKKDSTYDGKISLFFKSNDQINSVKRFLNNIILIANIEYKSGSIVKQVRHIDNFFEFKNVLGSGAEGSVHVLKPKFNDMMLAIKYLRNEGSLYKEFINYYYVNKMREYLPNFSMTLGMFKCQTRKPNSSQFNIDEINQRDICDCVETFTNEGIPVKCYEKEFLLLEFMDTPEPNESYRTIQTFIKSDNFSITELLSYIIQVCISITLAYDILQLVHNDLNTRNVGFTKIRNKKTLLTYLVRDNTYSFYTNNLAVIFDFGASKIFKKKVVPEAENDYNKAHGIGVNPDILRMKLLYDKYNNMQLNTTEKSEYINLLTKNLTALTDMGITKETLDLDLAKDIIKGDKFFENISTDEQIIPNENSDIINFLKEINKDLEEARRDQQYIEEFKRIIEYNNNNIAIINKLYELLKNLDKTDTNITRENYRIIFGSEISTVTEEDTECHYKFGLYESSERGLDKKLKANLRDTTIAHGGYIKKYNKYHNKYKILLNKVIQKGGIQVENKMLSEEIKEVIDNFRLRDITGFNDVFQINLENFNIDKLLVEFNYQNLYSNFSKLECVDNGGNIKTLLYGNPGDAKDFSFTQNDSFYAGIYPDQLPKNQTNQTDFTYAIVKDKYTGNYDIRFGKIHNATEIGGKHSTIMFNDDTYVSGELSIRFNTEEQKYDYYINTNSSKMDPLKTKVFEGANLQHPNIKKFGWEMLLRLAKDIFTKIVKEGKVIEDPLINHEFSTGTGDLGGLFEYYRDTPKKCPSDEFIKQYNEFGEIHKIRNACAEYESNLTNPSSNILHKDLSATNDLKVKKCKWDD